MSTFSAWSKPLCLLCSFGARTAAQAPPWTLSSCSLTAPWLMKATPTWVAAACELKQSSGMRVPSSYHQHVLPAECDSHCLASWLPVAHAPLLCRLSSRREHWLPVGAAQRGSEPDSRDTGVGLRAFVTLQCIKTRKGSSMWTLRSPSYAASAPPLPQRLTVS